MTSSKLWSSATTSLFALHTTLGKQEDIRCSAHSIAVNNDSFSKSRLLFEVDRNKASCKAIITWEENMLDWDPRVLNVCHEAGSSCTGAVWQKYCRRSSRCSHEVSWEFMERYIPSVTYTAATWNTSSISPVSLQSEDESRAARGSRVGKGGSSVSSLGWLKNSGPCAFCVPWEFQQLQSDSKILNWWLWFILIHLGA